MWRLSELFPHLSGKRRVVNPGVTQVPVLVENRYRRILQRHPEAFLAVTQRLLSQSAVGDVFRPSHVPPTGVSFLPHRQPKNSYPADRSVGPNVSLVHCKTLPRLLGHLV